MSPTAHDQLRARTCDVLIQLGALLDGLKLAREVNRLPSEPASDALVTLQHLEEAACAADSAQTLLADLAQSLDAQIEATKLAAAPLTGGAS